MDVTVSLMYGVSYDRDVALTFRFWVLFMAASFGFYRTYLAINKKLK